ncbi:MAG: hypothetical protein H0V70_08830 [Ktedonobacteraceae bacterium]|nr:hypothetical protein [Ktedonobacteraceae bacterium]
MKQFWMSVCVFLLLLTILLWLWLVWHLWNPDLALLPSGVIFLGLSFRRASRLPTVGERWYIFQQVCRIGFGLLVIIGSRHLIPFMLLSLATPVQTHPSLFMQIVQQAAGVTYWMLAIVMTLAAIMQLPWIEQRLVQGVTLS